MQLSPCLQLQPVLLKKPILFQDLVNWHRPRVAALLDAGADVLALETIPAQVPGYILMVFRHEPVSFLLSSIQDLQ